MIQVAVMEGIMRRLAEFEAENTGETIIILETSSDYLKELDREQAIMLLQNRWNLPLTFIIAADCNWKGSIKRWIKRSIDLVIRWRVNPIIEQQRDFNGAVLRLLMELMEENKALREKSGVADPITACGGEFEKGKRG